jgi:phosphoribosylanthranilate isomerase
MARPAGVRVKICGINSAAAVDAAVAAGADWIGFVFFPRSPRAIMPAEAARLSARAPASAEPGAPQRVGLFVEPTDAEIGAVLEAAPLDVLQVYTDAPRAAAIRLRFGLPVWRAVGIGVRTDLPDELAGADALVIEAKAAADATRPGGNAQRLDWSLLRGWRAPGQWLLAGGLSPENVAAAIAASGAAAVDVSSGVEHAPGRKDPALIWGFIAAARGLAVPRGDPGPASG